MVKSALANRPGIYDKVKLGAVCITVFPALLLLAASAALANNDLRTYQLRSDTRPVSYSTDSSYRIWTISAPDLAINLVQNSESSDFNHVDAGDSLSYSIVVTNMGGTEASDLTLAVPVVDGLEPASVATVQVDNVNTADYSGSLEAGTFALNQMLKAGSTLSVTYTRDVSNNVIPNQSLTSTASVSWNNGANDAPSQSGTATSELTVASAQIALAVSSVNPQGSAGHIVVGDVLSYDATVTLPEGIVNALTVNVTLPAGLGFVSGSEQLDATGFSGTAGALQSAVITTSREGVQQIVIELSGTTTTTANGNSSDNSLVIAFQADVRDSEANSASRALQNKQASASIGYTDFSGAAVSANTTKQFAEHDLAITSTVTPAEGLSAGDTITIQYVVTNNGTAPAYDVVISEAVNTSLLDATSITASTTPAGYSFGFTANTVTFTAAGTTVLPPGQSVTVAYQGVARSNVQSGAAFTLNAQAVGDSQQGSPKLQRAQTRTRETVAATENPTVESITSIGSSATWTAHRATPELAIGETQTYEVTVNIPEGLTQDGTENRLLSVLLPDGLQYIANSGKLAEVSDSGLQSSVLTLSPTAQNVSVGQDGKTLLVNVGDVQNNDNDNNAEQLVFTFKTLALNTTANNRGDTKSVQANINYINQANRLQSHHQSTQSVIVEPNVGATLTANPTSVTGGQTVTFTLVLENQSGTHVARGWDWLLAQTLPSRLTYSALQSAILSRGNVDVAACLGQSGQEISVNANCLAQGERYLAPGETITLIYEANVDPAIGFEEQINAEATVSLTSLKGNGSERSLDSFSGSAGSDTGERTGTNRKNTSNQAVNQLRAVASETLVAGAPQVSLQTSASDVVIGQAYSYTVSFSLPTGTTDNFTYTLDLPAGLSYSGEPIIITQPDSQFSYTGSPDTSPVAGTNPVELNLGSITNSASVSQQLTIEVPVSVDNSLANQEGEVRTATATLNYQGATQPLPGDTSQVTLREPDLELTQQFIGGAADKDAGDTVRYQTTLTNQALHATAYQVDVRDVMPAELLGAPDGSGTGLTFSNISVVIDSGDVWLNGSNTVVSSTDAIISQTNQANDTISLPALSLGPNASVTLAYDVVLANSAQAGQTLTSTAQVDYTSLVDGGGRTSADGGNDDNDATLNNYLESVSSTMTVNSALALQTRLSARHTGTNFTLGDTVTLDNQVDLVEGDITNVVFTLDLPDGTRLGNSTVSVEENVSYTGTATAAVSGNRVTVDLGNVSNTADASNLNDFLTIALDVIIEDSVQVNAGDSLTFTGNLSSDAAAVGPVSQAIAIIEPALTTQLQASKNVVSLGDTVTYTFTATPGANSATAHDSQVTLQLPDGLELVTGSFAGQGSSDTSVPGQLAVDLGAITVADGAKTFTFKAQIANDAVVNSALNITTVTGTYTSAAGTNPDERSYSFTVSESVSVGNAAFLAAAQSVALSYDANGNGVADAGDELTVTALMTNNGADVSNVVFSHPVPTYTTLVVGSVIAAGATIDTSNGVSVSQANLAGADSLSVEFVLRVDDAVQPGALITLQGQVDSDDTVGEPTDADNNDQNGDQPNLVRVGSPAEATAALNTAFSFSLTGDADSNQAVSAGDTLELNLQVTNSGSEAITNLALQQTLPAGLTFVSGTVAGGSVSASGQTVDAVLASLPANAIATVTLTVQVDAPLVNTNSNPDSELFSLNGSLNADQLPSQALDANGIAVDGAQPLQFTAIGPNGTAAPAVQLSESWWLSKDIDGDGLVDNADEISYRVRAYNTGSQAAQDVRIVHPLPADSQYVTGSASVSQGVIVAEAPVTANLGNLAAGGSATLTYVVKANGSQPDFVLQSQGTVSGANFTDVLSDANSDSSDGVQAGLVSVTDAAAPAFAMQAQLVSTSNPATDGATFIQGETLTLDYTLTIPAGAYEQGELYLELPGTMQVQAQAGAARAFDNALSFAANPGQLNQAAAQTPVAVTLVQTAQAAQLSLGGVINADNDANAEELVVTITVDTASLVPQASLTPLDIVPAFSYVDSRGVPVYLQGAPLQVELQNQLPAAVADSFTLNEDSAATTLAVLANDSDADNGQFLLIDSIDSTSTRGAVTLNETATALVYTPATDDNGQDSVSYTVTDQAGGFATATAQLTINALPDAPVAIADSLTVAEDNSGQLQVTANDIDVDGETITLVSASADVGSVTVVDSQTVRYTPAADFYGDAVVTYQITDPTALTSQGSLTVTVTPVNDTPVIAGQVDAQNAAIMVMAGMDMDEDSQLTVPLASIASDIDGDVLSLSGLASDQGTVSVDTAGGLLFVPTADFNGPAQISFVVSDTAGGSATGRLPVTVLPINDAPVLTASPQTTFIDAPLTIGVLAAARDVDEDDLTISSMRAVNGSVSLGGAGDVIFTPVSGFEGEAEVEVCITDGGAPVCGTWPVAVISPNAPPILEDMVIEIGEDQSIALALEGIDPDGDNLTYELLSAPAGKLAGTLPRVTYTPTDDFNGEDSFTYVASDGIEQSKIATVTVRIGEQNDKPLALDDTATAGQAGAILIPVLDNDRDPEGDALTVIGVKTRLGQVSIENNAVRYQPASGFSGFALVHYTIRDTAGQTASAKVLVTVDGEVDPLAPVITVPADILEDANALFTKIDLGVASAVDRLGNPLPVSLVDGVTFYKPGTNIAYWSATDAAGRQSIASQLVRVRPLVSLDKDQFVLEGQSASVGVHLNGASPNYPLVIPFEVSGTAGAQDHDLIAGQIVLQAGTTARIRFDTFSDALTEGDETIEVSLSAALNRGNKATHTMTIAEQNVDPRLTLNAVQSTDQRVVIARNGGDVVVSSEIAHPDATNVYQFSWQVRNDALTDTDSEPATFTFDPSALRPGIYMLTAQITDADDTAYGDTNSLFLQVVDSLATLTGQDSDGDGIPDDVEGYKDTDRDSIPDWQDPINECNVLPEEREFVNGYLVEGDPGVCLRIGDGAIRGQTGGAQIIEDDMSRLAGLAPDDQAQNVGGIFDFIAYGLPRRGDTYSIVMPQRNPVPEQAVYRKYTEATGWVTFDESGANQLRSTAGEPGYCPPPGGDVWTPGLTAGHWCVQVSITDGGPNDADGIANSTVVDPGGVGVLQSQQANQAPVAADDEYEMIFNAAQTFAPLGNDSDADGDTLRITSVAAPLGTATFSDTEVTYTPPANFVGQVTLVYGITDNRGGTASADMVIEVVDNRAPIVVGEQITVVADSITQIDVLANDSDPDADTLSVVEAQAEHGSVFILPNQELEYVAAKGFEGTDRITYTVADDNFAEQSGTVQVEVEPKPVRIENKSGGALYWLLLLGAAAAWQRRYLRRLGYRLALATPLSERWQLELGYTDLGEVSTAFSADTTTPAEFFAQANAIHPSSVSGAHLSVAYRVWQHHSGEIQLHGGLFAWQAEYASRDVFENSAVDASQNEDGVDGIFGARYVYHFSSRWQVGIDAERYYFADDHGDLFSLNIRYVMGRKEHAQKLN